VTFTFEGEDAFDVDLEDYHQGIDSMLNKSERDDRRILGKFCAKMFYRLRD